MTEDVSHSAPTAPENERSTPRVVNAWAAARRQHKPRRLARSEIGTLSVLGLLLCGIVGVAFRGSWTAHRDAALAIHFDHVGAALYPLAPDGLIIVALLAATVLRHDLWARVYSLSVVAIYTLSSFLINHWHGLGWFSGDPASGRLPALHWPVVALIAAQLIGAIGLGSHLFVEVVRHLFPGTPDDQGEHPGESALLTGSYSLSGTPIETVPAEHLPPDPEEVAAIVYGLAMDLKIPVGRDKLATACGIPVRAAIRVRKAVEQEREEAEIGEPEPTTAELPAVLDGTRPITIPHTPDAVLNGAASTTGGTP